MALIMSWTKLALSLHLSQSLAQMARRAVILLCSISLLLDHSWGSLRVGFYSSTCPAAESIVRSAVRTAITFDWTITAPLLRLHFHDCFVQAYFSVAGGCDGSILIDGPTSEKTNPAHAGLRGFDVIEAAKSQVEQVCPGIVSCSDIVALAARDSVSMSGGPSYQVETGRRDGIVSVASDAGSMPDVNDPISVLKAKFAAKGLSASDLVLLSAGGHSIGTAACFFMTKRLYAFTPAGGSDRSINPAFLPALELTCPVNGDVNVRLPLDQGSQFAFDKSILNNIRLGFAVLASDAQLYADPSTRRVVDSYFGLRGGFIPDLSSSSFHHDFANAMVKMGRVGVKTGSQGVIRRVCSRFN
ncbi:Peroxidase 43 [Nymphaea thermarum]|nr:Peroxidase 43 [Nymphaea thermarum]